MSEDRMFSEEEILKRIAPLPVLSTGFRSRVLAAAVEAQESRRHSRRVIAGSLSVFALLSWISWRGPISRGQGTSLAAAVSTHDSSSPKTASDTGLGIVKSLMGDDVSAIEVELRSRQDHFPRVHQM